MRYFLLLFFSFLVFIDSDLHAQLPKEAQQQLDQGINELKKQVTDLEKQIADAKKNKEDPETIKDMEEQLKMLKDQLAMIGKVTKTVSSMPAKNIQQVMDNDDDIPRFPKMNAALLESLPKINSQSALTNYVTELHNHFLKKINPELIASFKEIQSKLENDGSQMASAAVSAWYSEDPSPSQAILLITKAAMSPKASDLTMNNLGAMLNMGGLEVKSIPMLNYLADQHPDNAMILNNLGQAYAGVGDLNKAMMFFGRCLQIEPNHPQANNTAGEIELSRGNATAATQYFKNSLKGAFTDEATKQVRFVEPEMDINDYVKNKMHMPEYFNENKYNVPPQCQSVNEAEALTAVYNGYKDMLGALLGKYYELKKEYTDKTGKQMDQRYKDALALKKLSNPPFYVRAGYAWDALMKKYKSDGEWLSNMDKDFENRKREIRDRPPLSTKSDCSAQTAEANRYLRDMADITKAWQLKHTAFNKKYINQIIYWSFLFSFSSDEFKMKYYLWIINYLEEMMSIARTELIGPPCETLNEGNTPAQEIVIEEPHCPIDLELKLIVGKIALNCERFSFSGGEGIKFKYEKNFSSKQSTLAMGIGATLELASKNFGGGFSGSASVDLGETVFITLDGNNSFSDFGMNAKAEASVKLSKESSVDLGNDIAKEVTRSKDIFGAEAGLKCSAGINSGLSVSGSASFNPGPLKALF